MVTKKNLLIITPQNLNKNKSAGDYRVYCLLKYLHKYFNICLMVINTKTQPKDKTLNKKVRRKLYPVNSGIAPDSELLQVDPAVVCSSTMFISRMFSA